MNLSTKHLPTSAIERPIISQVCVHTCTVRVWFREPLRQFGCLTQLDYVTYPTRTPTEPINSVRGVHLLLVVVCGANWFGIVTGFIVDIADIAAEMLKVMQLLLYKHR